MVFKVYHCFDFLLKVELLSKLLNILKVLPKNFNKMINMTLDICKLFYYPKNNEHNEKQCIKYMFESSLYLNVESFLVTYKNVNKI